MATLRAPMACRPSTSARAGDHRRCAAVGDRGLVQAFLRHAVIAQALAHDGHQAGIAQHVDARRTVPARSGRTRGPSRPARPPSPASCACGWSGRCSARARRLRGGAAWRGSRFPSWCWSWARSGRCGCCAGKRTWKVSGDSWNGCAFPAYVRVVSGSADCQGRRGRRVRVGFILLAGIDTFQYSFVWFHIFGKSFAVARPYAPRHGTPPTALLRRAGRRTELHRAAALHISQPPLSLQIAQLERELGVKLFDRNNRRVALTEAGEAFLNDVRVTLGRLKDATVRAQAVDQGLAGRIEIGLSGSHFMGPAPALIARYRRTHPQVSVLLNEMSPAAQIERCADIASTSASRARGSTRSCNRSLVAGSGGGGAAGRASPGGPQAAGAGRPGAGTFRGAAPGHLGLCALAGRGLRPRRLRARCGAERGGSAGQLALVAAGWAWRWRRNPPVARWKAASRCARCPPRCRRPWCTRSRGGRDAAARWTVSCRPPRRAAARDSLSTQSSACGAPNRTRKARSSSRRNTWIVTRSPGRYCASSSSSPAGASTRRRWPPAHHRPTARPWPAPPSSTVASANVSPCLRVRTSSVGMLAAVFHCSRMPCGSSSSASGTSAVP